MAKVSFEHAHDRAVVSIDGELDWDAVRELLSAIEKGVEYYFYNIVELVISSPGGRTHPVEYLLKRLDELERREVRVRTRVVSTAGSGAAVIACTGHERVAEVGAKLSWHCTELSGERRINARETMDVLAALNRVDEVLIGRLARRVLATPVASSVSHKARATDREVLEVLARMAVGKTGRELPRKVRKLARIVGGYVDRAVREQDRKALERLYRRLFEIEGSVSAPLALTLRLVDRIGSGPAEARARGGDEGLTVPEWKVLFPPHGRVSRQALCRHVLGLGETGSGKTSSCILPVAVAMARAPRERLGAGLVIDPKRELGRVLRELAAERLHHVTADRVVLNVMAGPRWSLEDDLRSKRWLSAARRILVRAASFVPSSPARVLLDHEAGESNSEFFDREGTSLALSLLALVLLVLDPGTPSPRAWLPHDPNAVECVEALIERARGVGGKPGPNVLALAAWCLDGPLMALPRRDVTFTIPANGQKVEPPSQWLFARIARGALAALCAEPGEGRDLCERVLGYWASIVEVDRQYAGTRGSASAVFSDFATPSIASTLYLGCEPGFAVAGNGNGLDFARLVGRDAPGTLVLFEPSRDGLDNLVAIALKALFFESVLDDPDRAGGATDLPLVGYVADEFHRFVTSDPLHGEQSFLDTCRSFSAFCVVACQSLASIEHALAHRSGTYQQNRTSVEILWSNTANKLVFRSTDVQTGDWVAELSPFRPGLASVARVRPVSTLVPGECYAALADGRFERRRLGCFRAERLGEAT